MHVCVAAGLSTAVLLSQLAHAAAPAAPLPSTTDALHPWSLLQHWQAAATAYGLQGLQGSAAGRGVQDPYLNSALTLTLAAAALSGASQGKDTISLLIITFLLLACISVIVETSFMGSNRRHLQSLHPILP